MNRNLFVSPITYDTSTGFLPWMTMIMVLLATLSLAFALALNLTVGSWSNAVSHSFSVQVVPASSYASAEKTGEDIQQVKHILRQTPGIAGVTEFSKDQVSGLLAPWFGGTDLLSELPVPTLIDVQIAPQGNVDFELLRKKLSQRVEGVSLDVHQDWFNKVVRFAGGLKLISALILVLLMSGAAATVVYATVSSLDGHREAIGILHQIGAPDSYIAWIFGRRMFALAGFGSVFGFLLALGLILLVRTLARGMEVGFPAHPGLPWWIWGLLCLVPLGAAALASAAGYATVVHRLKRIL